MRRLLLPAFLIPVVLTVAMLLAVEMGRQQPAPAALAGMDDCRLPCWNGIHPGQTTMGIVDGLMAEQGFVMAFDSPRQNYSTYKGSDSSRICSVQVYYAGGFARGIVLTLCQDVPLGAWLALLGTPEHVSLSNTNPLLRGLSVMLVIPGADCTKWPISPFAGVSHISLSAADARSALTRASLGWHGFIPYWRYREFEPTAPVC